MGDDLVSADPLHWPGYLEALERARSSSEADESVVAGLADIGGTPVEVAAFDFSFLGGSMGEVAGERMARAMERAAQREVPFVLHTATGGARVQEGMRALSQMSKLAAARESLGAAHQPFVAVLGNPTTGGVLASLAALADITIAEAEATVGFAGPRLVESFTGRRLGGSHRAETALGSGLVDAVVPSEEVGRTVAHVLDVLGPGSAPTDDESARAPAPAAKSPWDIVQAARQKTLPMPRLLKELLPEHVVLQGDRAGREDPALIASIGRLRGNPVMCLATDRAYSPGPSAYRKALRCLNIAERLGLPVLSLVDTPGANPSEAAENAGIAWAIAELLQRMLQVTVPVLAVVTGEGGSGGGLALATGDVLLIYSNAFFSVIAPESAAEIMWRDPTRGPEAAAALKLTAPDLVKLAIADAVISDELSAASLEDAVTYHLARLGEQKDLAAGRQRRWRRHAT